MDTAYCYSGTEVLRNRLNIRSAKKLSIAERKLTMLRIADLLRRPVVGRFDLKHLCRIHEYIFQDIYISAKPSISPVCSTTCSMNFGRKCS